MGKSPFSNRLSNIQKVFSPLQKVLKQQISIALLCITLLALAIASLLCGSVPVPKGEAIDILLHGARPEQRAWGYIIWQMRVPQTITAILTGASLSTAGLLLQTIFRNPLAGPSILGIDSGANLGVAIVMLLLSGTMTLGGMSLSGYILVILAAIAGAGAVMLLLIAFSMRIRSHIMLLITGVMISYMASSVISLLNYSASAQGVQAYMVWGMGNFSSVSTERLPLFAGLCSLWLLAAILHIKPLNALLLGDQYATNLGYSIRPLRTRLLIITGLLTATTTAFCGPIAFIGLAVPHLARLVTGTSNHRLLLPTTLLMGAVLALACSLISNLPTSGIVIPINVITPCIGAPVVLWVILRKN